MEDQSVALSTPRAVQQSPLHTAALAVVASHRVPYEIAVAVINHPGSTAIGSGVALIGLAGLGAALIALLHPGLLHLAGNPAKWVAAGGLATLGVATAYLAKQIIQPEKRFQSPKKVKPETYKTCFSLSNKLRAGLGIMVASAAGLALVVGAFAFATPHLKLVTTMTNLTHLSTSTLAIGGVAIGATGLAMSAAMSSLSLNERSQYHSLTEGSKYHSLTEGSKYHSLTEGSKYHSLTEGSKYHDPLPQDTVPDDVVHLVHSDDIEGN